MDFSCSIKTVYTFLKERDALSLLEDNNLALATQDVRIVCPPGLLLFFLLLQSALSPWSTLNRKPSHLIPRAPMLSTARVHTHTHTPATILFAVADVADGHDGRGARARGAAGQRPATAQAVGCIGGRRGGGLLGAEIALECVHACLCFSLTSLHYTA